MKKLMMAGLVLVTSTVLFTACKKSDSSSNNAGLSATVNGTQFSAATNATYATKTTATGALIVLGATTSGTTSTGSIALYVDNFSGAVGTFNFADSDLTTTIVGSAIYTNSTTMSHHAKSGQIAVTSVTTSNIQGTFNFVTDSFTVTNGTFNTTLSTL